MTRAFRVLRRGLVLLLSFLLTLSLVGAAAVTTALVLTLPGGDGPVSIGGLGAPATLHIDRDGVARIAAQSERDAATVLGYAHARERMFQMELMRRAASGRLSELVGPATLPIDRLMRTLGLRHAAERDFPALDEDTRDVLEAYARGVNAWIAARGRRAGLPFLLLGTPEPWTPVDSLLWGKTMALYLSGNWRIELARLSLLGKMDRARIDVLWPTDTAPGQPQAALDPRLPEVAARLAALVPRFPAPFTLPATASNAWAVDGRHSVSGAPLLAGDPHLAFGLPGIWYLARIDTPHGVLAGGTAPGVPFLVVGHNGHIAWSFTTTGADTQDLFIETSATPGTYRSPDGDRPIEVKEERIGVRGQPDVTLAVRRTRHGPLISDLVDSAGPMLALSASDLQPGDVAASGLLALNRAATVAEAGDAAQRITAPVQNLLVADKNDIALFVTGRVPVRRAGDGAWPQAGADGAHDWVGWASGAELPRIVAPSSGRLVNANDRVAPADFATFLGRDWYGDWRARRIRELLDASPTHTAADFAAMQTDVVDRWALDLLPALLATVPFDAASAQALSVLRGWDGRMAIGLPQPLLVTVWMREAGVMLRTRLGVPAATADGGAPWQELLAHALRTHDCAGPCDTLLTKSLAAAMTRLTPEFGTDPSAWRWGAAHQAVFGDPLLRALPWLDRMVAARIAAPGGDTTIDRGGMRGDNLDSVHGASFRGAYDLADLDSSLFVVAPGQSGHPASPLARNFLRRWRDGAAIMLSPYADPVVTITLSPALAPPLAHGASP